MHGLRRAPRQGAAARRRSPTRRATRARSDHRSARRSRRPSPSAPYREAHVPHRRHPLEPRRTRRPGGDRAVPLQPLRGPADPLDPARVPPALRRAQDLEGPRAQGREGLREDRRRVAPAAVDRRAGEGRAAPSSSAGPPAASRRPSPCATGSRSPTDAIATLLRRAAIASSTCLSTRRSRGPRPSRRAARSGRSSPRRALRRRSPRSAAYHDDPGYVAAVRATVDEGIAAMRAEGVASPHVLFSAHGLPESFQKSGDPYVGQIQGTREARGGGARRPDDALVPEPRGARRLGQALHGRHDREAGRRGRRSAPLRAARLRLATTSRRSTRSTSSTATSRRRRGSSTCAARRP